MRPTTAALVSRHRSDVVGCAQPSESSARRIACPYRAVLASDATPRCASMASADRQMIGDATPDRRGAKVMQGALAPFDAHMAGQLRVTARAGHERVVAAWVRPGQSLERDRFGLVVHRGTFAFGYGMSAFGRPRGAHGPGTGGAMAQALNRPGYRWPARPAPKSCSTSGSCPSGARACRHPARRRDR